LNRQDARTPRQRADKRKKITERTKTSNANNARELYFCSLCELRLLLDPSSWRLGGSKRNEMKAQSSVLRDLNRQDAKTPRRQGKEQISAKITEFAETSNADNARG
jgi:hypothetical protein